MIDKYINDDKYLRISLAFYNFIRKNTNWTNNIDNVISSRYKNVSDYDFEYNKKLVALEKDSYPQEILDIMNKYQTYNCSKDTHEIEYQLTAEANQIGSVLDFI